MVAPSGNNARDDSSSIAALPREGSETPPARHRGCPSRDRRRVARSKRVGRADDTGRGRTACRGDIGIGVGTRRDTRDGRHPRCRCGVASSKRLVATGARARDDHAGSRPDARTRAIPTNRAVARRQATRVHRGGQWRTNESLPASARRSRGTRHSCNRGRKHSLLLARWSMAGLLRERRAEESIGGGRRAVDYLRSSPGGERDMGRERHHRVRHDAGVLRAVARVGERRRSRSDHHTEGGRDRARLPAAASWRQRGALQCAAQERMASCAPRSEES